MSRMFIFGCLFALLLYVGGRLSSPLAAAEGRDTRLVNVQDTVDKTDATPVSGPMTHKQVVHSKLLSTEIDPNAQWTISSLLEKSDNDTVSISSYVTLLEVPRTPEQLVADLVFDADAIILGKVEGATSNVTADNRFLFTDYEIRTLDVLKSNRAPIGLGDIITATRRGGKVIIDGKLVVAESNSNPPLKRGGELFILFLKYVPESGDYVCAGADSAFALKGDSLVPLFGEPRFGSFDRFQAFEAYVATLVPVVPDHR